MSNRDPEREARAERRRQTWTGGPGEQEQPATTASERLAAVWQVSCDAWALSGRSMPDYRREEMPGRVLRRGDGDR